MHRGWTPTAKWLVTTALALSLLSMSASAARHDKAPRQDVVALYLVPEGRPPPELHARLAAELLKSPQRLPSLQLLSGTALRRALGRKPDAAFQGCRNDVVCIAGLGKRARAGRVLYGRVSPGGTGIVAELLVIDVNTAGRVGAVRLAVTADTDVAALVAARYGELFPAAAAGAAGDGSDEIPLELTLGGEAGAGGGEIPLELALGGDTSLAAAAGDDEIPLELAIIEETSAGEPIGPAGAAAEPAGAGADVALEPSLAPLPVLSDGSGGLSWVAYTGIALAAGGAATSGAGAYFGRQSRSLRADVDYGPGGTPQPDAQARFKEANAAADRANLLFGIGGVVASVGVVLFALDLVNQPGDSEPSTTVTVRPGGAAVLVGWSW